ncbi:putative BOI-related E3 ubiquitin-protein ligase 2 [Ananas comosus]|uniref:Putative BOI-related E3 ubiquitin-protein ligase 2 n=1 Tax=Ananas comosus TaxID=4615 RepID=A0A199V7J3_ANACO|nr:putative BOI-related E3 ubiquitin-protein ligase 2 [Ananas comosus]
MIHDRSLLRAHAHAHAQFDAAYNNNNSGCGGAWAEENELVTPPPQNGPVPIQARVVAPAIDVGGGASTSGRPAGEDVVSHLHRQSAEIDAFVRLENEKLRWGLEEARRRHSLALASAAERGMERRLREKEAEVERARRRNAELEARVREMAAENEAWFGLARAHEATAASLRASLDRLLLLPPTTCSTNHPPSTADEDEDEDEGFADSSADPLLPQPQPQCCKACGDGEACVLLLPCRHLCACEGCAAELAACPVCRHVKNACLRVLRS